MQAKEWLAFLAAAHEQERERSFRSIPDTDREIAGDSVSLSIGREAKSLWGSLVSAILVNVYP